jgi:threonine synthase
MKYVSTRGAAPVLDFEEVLLAGLARDGGLYLPETWPQFSAEEIRALARLDYAELAARIARPFVGGAIPDDELDGIFAEAYAGFDHAAVAPLKQLDRQVWFLELFHGPTLAFKDMAMQVLGRLFDHVLARRGERVTIVGATSGDTGAAAIEACRDRPQIEIFILHPEGRVSEVQRRQMTTVTAANVHNIAIQGTFDDCQDLVKAMFKVTAANVHNIAIQGTFDDCQDLVKAMFNDAAFRDEMRLSAVNSINWARVMAQIAYYFAAAAALGAPERAVSFAVPTGNFGNIFAGYAARHHRDRGYGHGRGGADPFAGHGHPGLQQLRAPAVRALWARRRGGGGAAGGLPRQRRLRAGGGGARGPAPGLRRPPARRPGDRDRRRDGPAVPGHWRDGRPP